MAKQIAAASRYGWRWSFVLIGGLAWASLGCNPQTFSLILMPFTDNNVAPEYKLFAQDKEITLAILSRFARLETGTATDALGADAELTELIEEALHKRCAANKHRIKIIPAAQVRAHEAKLRQTSGAETSCVDLGKSLKADFVLDANMQSFSLFEKITYPPMYRGRTDLAISLYKMDAKEGHKVFRKDFTRIHPRDSGPIDAGNMNASVYRRVFLMHVANDISRMLIAYPPEEKRSLE